MEKLTGGVRHPQSVFVIALARLTHYIQLYHLIIVFRANSFKEKVDKHHFSSMNGFCHGSKAIDTFSFSINLLFNKLVIAKHLGTWYTTKIHKQLLRWLRWHRHSCLCNPRIPLQTSQKGMSVPPIRLINFVVY